jgi:hypothetical protein
LQRKAKTGLRSCAEDQRHAGPGKHNGGNPYLGGAKVDVAKVKLLDEIRDIFGCHHFLSYDPAIGPVIL